MIKKLIQRYRAYKDKQFAKRLDRVLKTHVIKSSVIIEGTLYTTGNVRCWVSEEGVKKIKEGNHFVGHILT